MEDGHLDRSQAAAACSDPVDRGASPLDRRVVELHVADLEPAGAGVARRWHRPRQGCSAVGFSTNAGSPASSTARVTAPWEPELRTATASTRPDATSVSTSPKRSPSGTRSGRRFVRGAPARGRTSPRARSGREPREQRQMDGLGHRAEADDAEPDQPGALSLSPESIGRGARCGRWRRRGAPIGRCYDIGRPI